MNIASKFALAFASFLAISIMNGAEAKPHYTQPGIHKANYTGPIARTAARAARRHNTCTQTAPKGNVIQTNLPQYGMAVNHSPTNQATSLRLVANAEAKVLQAGEVKVYTEALTREQIKSLVREAAAEVGLCPR